MATVDAADFAKEGEKEKKERKLVFDASAVLRKVSECVLRNTSLEGFLLSFVVADCNISFIS